MRHLSHSGTDTHSVLYVSPVVISDDDAAVSCMAAAACDTAREVLTGVATGTSRFSRSPPVLHAQHASSPAISRPSWSSAKTAQRPELAFSHTCAGRDAAPVLEGRIGSCCDDHPPEMDHGHSLMGPSQRFDSFSSVGASLDSAQHAEAFKHGYAKASQIVPYAPLRHGGHEPVHPDQLPEVGPCTDFVNALWMCPCVCWCQHLLQGFLIQVRNAR